MKGQWRRYRENGLIYVVPEDAVPIKVVSQWKRLLAAHDNLAHTANERKRGAEWATAEALDAARTELTRATDNWQAVCRMMGWKGRNGRTFPVHLSPAPTPDGNLGREPEQTPKPSTQMETKHTLHMRHDKAGNVRPESMHDHTPGPWTLRRYHSPEPGGDDLVIEAGEMSRDGITRIATLSGNDGAALAHGNLIAAAPDLLNACLDALQAADEMDIECPNTEGLRAAIAKATGNAA